MRSGSLAFGVLFVATGLGAALFVASEGTRRQRQRRFDVEVAAYESQLSARASAPGFASEIDAPGLAECLPADIPAPTIVDDHPAAPYGKPPRVTSVRYFYGDNRRHRPFREAEEFFPFVCGALAVLGLIGFLKTRAARAR